MRAVREGRKLTPAAFAGLLGVSTRTIRDLERHRRQPSRNVRADIAETFELDAATTAALFGGARPPTPLGRHVRSLRRSRGLTQDALAERIGVHPAALSRIEQGDRPLTGSQANTLAKELRLKSRERRTLLALWAADAAGRPTEPEADLPRALREARVTHGLSQRALAQLLGVHRNAVSAWESGRDVPVRSNRRALAATLPELAELLGAPGGPQTFEARLRAARERRGLTQAQLAERAGSSASRMSDFERGASQPSPEALHAILDALEPDGAERDALLRAYHDR